MPDPDPFTIFDRLALRFDRGSQTPLYQQLVVQLEAAITSGRVQAGEQLPSAGVLNVKLDVSAGVVVRAYRILRTRGLIERSQVGTFVRPQVE